VGSNVRAGSSPAPDTKIIQMNEKELEKFSEFLHSLSEDQIDSLIELMEAQEEINWD
jgi:hypothetical protein